MLANSRFFSYFKNLPSAGIAIAVVMLLSTAGCAVYVPMDDYPAPSYYYGAPRPYSTYPPYPRRHYYGPAYYGPDVRVRIH